MNLLQFELLLFDEGGEGVIDFGGVLAKDGRDQAETKHPNNHVHDLNYNCHLIITLFKIQMILGVKLSHSQPDKSIERWNKLEGMDMFRMQTIKIRVIEGYSIEQ